MALRRGETVWLVTFNYDTMLEAHLNSTSPFSITAMDQYVSEGHPVQARESSTAPSIGFREVDVGPSTEGLDLNTGARVLGRAASSLMISQRYTAPPTGRQRFYYGTFGKTVYPAIAIPVESKEVFECPAEHLAALTKALPEIDRMIVIGWRAAEEHFLKLLREHLAKPVIGMVVSATRDGATSTAAKLDGILPKRGFFYPAKGASRRRFSRRASRSFFIGPCSRPVRLHHRSRPKPHTCESVAMQRRLPAPCPPRSRGHA